MRYSRYEKARIIGARALQISLGAPALIDIPPEIHDSVKIALYEFENGCTPITAIRSKMRFNKTLRKVEHNV
ncbi:MAG: DNA-directed RNA polymerase subunit K [Candidatus Thermoplasmatota archaeon]|nr:DNA-directed RNA polymerase subunit K [Candidatus Thermoplasmatota archaeon]